MKTELKYLGLVMSVVTTTACASLSANTDATQDTPLPAYNTETLHHTVQNSEASSQQSLLTLKQIMSDPDWLGRQPESARFSPVGDSVLYQRKREGEVIRDFFKIDNPSDINGKQVPLSAIHEADIENLIDDEDSEYVAWLSRHQIFVQHKQNKEIKQLTQANLDRRHLRFADDQQLSFQSGDAFYVIDIKTGAQRQVIEWSFSDAPSAVEKPSDYIAEQQIALIEYLRVKREQRQQQFSNNEQTRSAAPHLFVPKAYLPKDQELVLASLSPDQKWLVLAARVDLPTRDESDIMPDYIEENGRIKAQAVRQRVADAKSERHFIYLINTGNGEATEINFNSLPGYNEDVLADVKRENAQREGKTYENNRLPRDIGLLFDWYASEMPIKWHDESDKVALMLEAWDNKDRWIATVDVDDKKLVNQHRMHDKAWVNYRYNQFGWFDNSETLYFLSEQSGYSQIYIKPVAGDLKAVTQGRFVVDNVTLSHDDRYFYYKANKKHPGIYEIYRTDIQANQTDALTDLNGMTDYQLNQAQDRLLLTHSTTTMPPELYLIDNMQSGQALKITNTVSEAFKSINWVAPSIVAIPSSHTEQPIYSRVYTPTNSDTQKRRAVVFNHGAGYLQNAHMGWSGYFREFMFHSLLVNKGYVVLDMDYRASAGYGRDWRTAIYRQMGTPEVEDLVDGVNWLVQNANVDEKRVGTYGGSYGGFLTFMAMFNEPELFKAGAALRPVSDWAHYNTPYTANILNTPELDPIAYERSSPIYFAEGLTNPLLINAPMVDDNVFFVDVVRLVQRLIELEKENFETAIYPVEPHGFVQASSWLDEYRRILKLFESEL